VRLLIVRTSALGDIVQSLPVAMALRRHFPRATIGWAIEESFAPLLAGHPAIDTLIVLRLRAWRRALHRASTWREIGGFLEGLTAFGAEVALDLMGNHKGAILAAASLAERRIGFARQERREPASGVWINEPVATGARHAVDRYLGLLAALGVPPGAAEFGGELLLPEFPPVESAEPYAFLHPGAAWANKRYPPALWGEVARGLAAQTGLRTRVGAAPGEGDLAAAVIAAAGGAADLAPAPTLAALVALERGARLVLGGDSGPLHLARALGRPVVAVMGPTDPARHGPYGAAAAAVVHELPCSFCQRRLPAVKPCLTRIAPPAVVAAALAALDAASRDVDPFSSPLLK